MNAMGHDVPTMIGVDHRGVAKQITKLIPDYMVMGERGMADMAEMEMPLPDNTAADDDRARARSARSEWAACSRVVKVRKDQKRGDYSDPGWYQHPPGTRGLRVDRRAARTGALQGRGPRFDAAAERKPAHPTEVKVRKPQRALPAIEHQPSQPTKGHAMQAQSQTSALAVASQRGLRSRHRSRLRARRRSTSEGRPCRRQGAEGMGHRRRCRSRQADDRRRP